jgi:hypothetical protein
MTLRLDELMQKFDMSPNDSRMILYKYGFLHGIDDAQRALLAYLDKSLQTLGTDCISRNELVLFMRAYTDKLLEEKIEHEKN